MKIRPVVSEFIHADGQRKGQTDMTKVIVSFCNFANAPKNETLAPDVSTEIFNVGIRYIAICGPMNICDVGKISGKKNLKFSLSVNVECRHTF